MCLAQNCFLLFFFKTIKKHTKINYIDSLFEKTLSMVDTITIFHNPRCSKSRQTLAILEENGVSPKIVRYLDTPPSINELESILSALAMYPIEITRKGEKVFKELDIKNAALSDKQLTKLLCEYPILIERPIVVRQDRAVIGRPPEKVLELLD